MATPRDIAYEVKLSQVKRSIDWGETVSDFIYGYFIFGFVFFIPYWFIILFASLFIKDILKPLEILYLIGFSFWFLLQFIQTKRCNHGVFSGTAGGCKPCLSEEEERIMTELEKEREEYRVAEEENRKKREEEHKRLQSLEYLLSLEPAEFEDAVANLFKELGYSVVQTPYSSDGGKDAIAYRDGVKYFIECKRYGLENTVGRPELQKFYGAMVSEGAASGFFVTTSSFNQNAYEFVQNEKIKPKDIKLIDGEQLISMMQQAFKREHLV